MFALAYLILRCFRRFHSGTPDPAVVKGFMDVLSTKLDTYEKILSNQKYLAGDVSTTPELIALSLCHNQSFTALTESPTCGKSRTSTSDYHARGYQSPPLWLDAAPAQTGHPGESCQAPCRSLVEGASGKAILAGCQGRREDSGGLLSITSCICGFIKRSISSTSMPYWSG